MAKRYAGFGNGSCQTAKWATVGQIAGLGQVALESSTGAPALGASMRVV